MRRQRGDISIAAVTTSTVVRVIVHRWPEQRFCRAHCRRMGKALEGRSSRKAWIEAGRPIQSEVRAAFDRDHRPVEGNFRR